jgi:hypothetical protein
LALTLNHGWLLRNHEDLLKAIDSGNPKSAEKMARTHGLTAANELISRLRAKENVLASEEQQLSSRSFRWRAHWLGSGFIALRDFRPTHGAATSVHASDQAA